MTPPDPTAADLARDAEPGEILLRRLVDQCDRIGHFKCQSYREEFTRVLGPVVARADKAEADAAALRAEVEQVGIALAAYKSRIA